MSSPKIGSKKRIEIWIPVFLDKHQINTGTRYSRRNIWNFQLKNEWFRQKLWPERRKRKVFEVTDSKVPQLLQRFHSWRCIKLSRMDLLLWWVQTRSLQGSRPCLRPQLRQPRSAAHHSDPEMIIKTHYSNPLLSFNYDVSWTHKTVCHYVIYNNLAYFHRETWFPKWISKVLQYRSSNPSRRTLSTTS